MSPSSYATHIPEIDNSGITSKYGALLGRGEQSKHVARLSPLHMFCRLNGKEAKPDHQGTNEEIISRSPNIVLYSTDFR